MPEKSNNALDPEDDEVKIDYGEKKRRQLPAISDYSWTNLNRIRKEHKITWNEFMERIVNYEDWTGLLLSLPRRASIGDKLNAVTVMHYMPLWLDNLYHNFFDEHECPECHKTHPILKDMPDLGTTVKGIAKDKPAIVIGAGPSLWKYNHLEILANSQFYKQHIGPILTTSHTLKDCLEADVIPDYFILLDPEPCMIEHLNHSIIDEYADKVTGIFSITTQYDVLKRWKGKKIFFMAAISDITIPNVQGMLSGIFPMLTEMNALANAGTFAWNVAKTMGCNPIVLIGMDEGFLPETPPEETPYYNAFARSYSTQKEIVDHCFHFHTHSFFKTNAYTDDIYKNFAKNQIAAARLAKKYEGIITKNCSGGGVIDDPDAIENEWFEDFLDGYDKNEQIEDTERN